MSDFAVIDSSVPLVYTANGNVPESTLRYEKQWKIDTEMISFFEFWYDASGALVKNNVHLCALKGLPPIGSAQAQM